MSFSDEILAVLGLVIRVKKVMPRVVRGLTFTVKAIFTRTFTKMSGIIIKNRSRYLSKPSIDAYSSYKEIFYPGRTNHNFS